MSASRACGLLLVAMCGVAPLRARAEPHCAHEMTEEAGAGIAVLITNAEAAQSLGHPDEAYALFQQAFCLYPDPILKHGLSATALKANRCDEALNHAVFWELHGDASSRPEAVRWLQNVEEQCSQVRILSDPAGATIVLDNAATPFGTTPWTGRLRAGNYDIALTRDGFTRDHRSVTIPSGPLEAPVQVVFTLRPVLLAATPPPARPATPDFADLPLDAPMTPPPAHPAIQQDPPHSAVEPPPQLHAAVVRPPPEHRTTRPPDPKPLRLAAEAPPKPRPPSPPWVAPVSWAAIGVGAAALIVATALGVVAHNNTTALHTTAEPGVAISSRVDAINGEAAGANALFAVGGVLAAAGVGIRLAF